MSHLEIRYARKKIALQGEYGNSRAKGEQQQRNRYSIRIFFPAHYTTIDAATSSGKFISPSLSTYLLKKIYRKDLKGEKVSRSVSK
jgi:hypothetical protein